MKKQAAVRVGEALDDANEALLQLQAQLCLAKCAPVADEVDALRMQLVKLMAATAKGKK